MSRNRESGLSPGTEQAWYRAGLLAAPIFWLFGGALYAQIPPSPDQFFLDYTGWMTLEGAVPYETFVDGNWPACHWLHALSTFLFGNTPHSWRILDFLFLIGSTLALADLVRRLWGPASGLSVLFLLPGLYVVTDYWMAGQRDILGANLCFVVLWCYWRGLSLGRPLWQVAAGLLLAFCALIKPTFALLGFALLGHALVSAAAGAWTWRQALGQVTIAGSSSVVGLAMGLGVVVLQGAALESFYESAFRSVVVRFGTESVGLLPSLRRALATGLNSWHWILAIASLSWLVRLRREGLPGLAGNLLFPSMWIAGMAAYIAQAQALHYTLGFPFVAVIPVLCSGVGLAIEELSRASGWRRLVAAGCLLLVAGGTAKKWVGTFQETAQWLLGQDAASDYLRGFDVGDGVPAAEAYQLASVLADQLAPEETVLVWGRANAINFLAERPQPTRFHHNVTLFRPGLPADVREKYAVWFQEDLESARPLVCLVNQRELEEFRAEPSVAFLIGFLRRDYEPVRRVGESLLYRRTVP